jgi:uncharacterized protein YegJ (DUF2314 family)
MSEIYKSDAGDAEMNAAIEEAQSRFPQFRRELEADLKRFIPALGQAVIKARLVSASTGAEELLWIDVTKFKGDQVIGKLANDPENIPEVKSGQEVAVNQSDVVDWAYQKAGKLVGAFTEAVIEKRERKK